MKPVFICQLREEAQADIKRRLETITEDPNTVEMAMSDKLNIVLDIIEDVEQGKLDLALSWVDDDRLYDSMLQTLWNYQVEKRRWYL